MGDIPGYLFSILLPKQSFLFKLQMNKILIQLTLLNNLTRRNFLLFYFLFLFIQFEFSV